MKLFLNTLGIFILFSSTVVLHAQSNEGIEFWFAFMEHVDVYDNEKVVMITSKFDTKGSVRIPNRNWTVDYTVKADDVTFIQLPDYTENVGSEVYDDTGVQVVSEKPISVYIHQYHTFRSEASVILPVSSLGNSYFTMTYKGVLFRGTVHPSEFLIVAVEDETRIEIVLSNETMGGKQAGSLINIELDKGETYQVQASSGPGDLSGTKISGEKNFAVFSGNSWTEVPTGCEARDNLLEQMYAISKWGKKVVTVPSASVSYDIFRIMASEDNTQIEVSGKSGIEESFVLNEGAFVEKRYADAKFVSADKPIQVAQFLIGSGCGGHTIGDPSMVILNSVTQTRDTVTLFNSSLQEIEENYINIIALTSDIPLITIDGLELPNSAEISTVDANGLYSFVRVGVDAGAHTIVSEGCGVIATAYGYGIAESYAYSGGASFNEINANPITDGGCLNDTVFFDANLPESRYSFLWDLGDDVTFDTKSFEIFYNELGTYPVDLILTDECIGTVDTFQKDIKITLRQALDAFGDTTLCAEGSFTLGATDVESADFLWTGPNNFFSEEQFPLVQNADENMSGQYAVRGVVSGCATFPSFAEVEILSLPEPDFDQDSIYCNRDEDILLNPGSFSDYQWHDGSSEKDFLIEDDGLYAVTVTGENGCLNSEWIVMEESCPTAFYIPNIFSPNNDGFNDVWKVYGLDITSFSVEVKNRWGELIFSSKDIEGSWDGKFLGRPAAEDVYMYTVKVKGRSDTGEDYMETVTGTMTLVR